MVQGPWHCRGLYFFQYVPDHRALAGGSPAGTSVKGMKADQLESILLADQIQWTFHYSDL
ncbi:MAG: hypothetical protein EOO39_03940 [Cytophagaceae bacterium]|nr:MAG: hypothetical protein EOO39_03940 [Cytophagaceae bacterium]